MNKMNETIAGIESKIDFWKKEVRAYFSELQYLTKEMNKWTENMIEDGNMDFFKRNSERIIMITSDVNKYEGLISSHEQLLKTLKEQA
ncbi:hypothetical protein H7K13_23740 [Priestia aryabhattai]|uniref:hypothetical protein n=1 Tax=Priestia aryabhattai TaxID=412384 RepID=UPI001C8EE088|nr:hypothetical protein [Priestia aryabhattai]MBY0077942.1 hypothetical protein [Priestia aryabhattai]